MDVLLSFSDYVDNPEPSLPKLTNMKDAIALTQRIVENSFHPCVTSERSFSVVPTYTRANVSGCNRKQRSLVS